MKNSILAKIHGHAVLLVGPDQDTNLAAIKERSQFLLCIKPFDTFCGNCKSCHLVKAGVHPDLCIITLADDSNSIQVDQIRGLNNFIIGKPQISPTKIVILYPAEAMTIQASNALLKSLEEPGENTVIFLLAEHKDLLLKTIVSRCQVLTWGMNTKKLMPEQHDTLFAMREDLIKLVVNKNLTSIQLVEKWVKQWPRQVLYWFELLLSGLITSKYTLVADEQDALIKLITSEQLWQMLDQVRQARNWLEAGQRPNLQLVLDSIFVEL